MVSIKKIYPWIYLILIILSLKYDKEQFTILYDDTPYIEGFKLNYEIKLNFLKMFILIYQNSILIRAFNKNMFNHPITKSTQTSRKSSLKNFN